MARLDLNKLEQYRDEVLKAEIGALLFNLGKTHIGIGFWRRYFREKEQLFQGYSDYFVNEKKRFFFKELKNIEDKLEKFFKEMHIKINYLLREQLPIVELLKGQKSKSTFVNKIFFQGCENINSAIDKNFPNDIRIEPKPFITNVFGSFKEEVNEKNFDEKRKEFLLELNKFLNEKNYYQRPNWEDIRNFILKKIKNWYSHLLSDSRFPVNDVTLWDQAYMTASMFKAVLSQLVMDDSKLKNYQDNPSSIKWRILGIQYDKLGLIEKSLKLASIEWYRRITEKIDGEIKKLLEVDYPIGNEVYKDETGIYFIVGEDINDLPRKIRREIKNIFENTKLNEEREVEGLRNEVSFYIALSEPSRGLMNLSALLEKARNNFLKKGKIESVSFEFDTITHNGKKCKVKKGSNYTWISKKDLSTGETTQEKVPNTAIGICPICQVRLLYMEDKQENNKPIICEVCSERIHHLQVGKWLKDTEERIGETIWIEEVKDKNNRVAYISLKFELEDWLNGDLLNSLLGNLGDTEVGWNMQKKYIELLVLNKLELLENEKIFNFIKICNKLKELEEIIFSIIEALKNIINKEYLKERDEFVKKLEENYLNKLYILESNSLFNCNDIFSLIKANHLILGLLNFLHRNKDKIKSSSSSILTKIEKIKETSEDLKVLIEKSGNKFKEYEKEIFEIFPFSINPELGRYYHKYSSFRDFFNFVIFSNIENERWKRFIQSNLSNNYLLDFKKRTIKWNLLTNEDINLLTSLFLQFIFRKNPSPARLRRIWETTREFFEDIHNNLDEILEIPEWRKKRLVWEANLNSFEKSMELEGDGLLFWAEKAKNKIYLISSIEDFLNNFGNKEIKEALSKGDNGYLTSLFKNLKSKINAKEINLKPYNSKYNEENNIKIITNKFKGIISYKPFAKITAPSPRSYQVIIPADRVEIFIDKVMEKYNKEFKYVYGKLPLHIGIIVSHYKRPAYVNLKALRRMRRDVKDINKLYESKNIREFCIHQRKKLSSATQEELINNTEAYYSLYWNNLNKRDYNFYIKPQNNWRKWISTIDKFPQNSDVEIIPNTFDFEFMDTNTRRNDIFYSENNKYKRAIKRKSNRPYEIEEHWEKFKAFKELVTAENYKRSRLFKIMEVVYSRLREVEELNTDYSHMLAPIFYRYLDLKDKERRKTFRKIFNINENLSSQKYVEELRKVLSDKRELYLFIDMFEFWHTALKEV